MSSTNYSSDHITFSSSDYVKGLCREFFAVSGITNFATSIYYYDGSRGILCTNPELAAYAIDSGLLTNYSCKEIIPYKNCYLHSSLLHLNSLSTKMKNKISEGLRVDKEIYNSDYKFTIREQFHDHVMLSTFSAKTGNTQILNYYLNNKHDMEQFILRFKSQAKELITAVKNDRIIKPWRSPEEVKVIKSREQKKNQSILNEKEIYICSLICKGFTASEIAEKMCRSKRTVESYLEVLKEKMHCRNAAQLAAKFVEEYTDSH